MTLKLSDLERALESYEPTLYSASQYAAVAIIFREQRKQLELLVIQRAHHPRDPWSGHLAFPGGRQEPHEASLETTAVRETLEELGLDLTRSATALGPADQLRAPRHGRGQLVVAPYVYALTEQPILKPEPSEVHRYFWVELAPLLSGNRDTQVEIHRDGMKYSLPGYQIEDQVLWGMTYQMLDSVLALTGHQRSFGRQNITPPRR